MGYTLSERAFKYAEIYLDELLNSDQDEFVWEVSDSRDFARRLRQGIRAAGKLEKDTYKNLLDIYQFKETPNQVIAVRRKKIVVKPVGIHKKVFNEVSSLSELITEAIKNSHLNVLVFPSVNLDENDIEQLRKFNKAKGWLFNLTSKELQKWQAPTEKQLESLTN
jgi:hypothetical protein